MSETHRQDLNWLLQDVSRSFYLTLRVLPRRIRSQIGLAYLLARATDTIADTGAIPVAERLASLEGLRARILGESNEALDLRSVLAAQDKRTSPAELTLLARVEDLVRILTNFEFADRQRIRRVLNTITSGQKLDLQRFVCAGGGEMVALRNDAELDDYTYRVAGCVGEFWTLTCRAHLFPNVPLDDAWLLTNGIRFGKGLQLLNILRDLPEDLQAGRCYLPWDRLMGAGLTPADLLAASNAIRFRELYGEYLTVAARHLEAGWEYTKALPFRQVRLRLACAWPLLIGAATIEKLQTHTALEAGKKIKISRREVRSVLVRSIIWYPWPHKWDRLFPSAQT